MPILSNEAMASQWKHSLISCVYLRSGRPNCTLNAVASRSGQNIFPVSSHGNYNPSLSCLVLSVFLCISSCRAKVCVCVCVVRLVLKHALFGVLCVMYFIWLCCVRCAASPPRSFRGGCAVCRVLCVACSCGVLSWLLRLE